MSERRQPGSRRRDELAVPAPAAASTGSERLESGLGPPGQRRRRVLFALTELDYPTPALRRVAAMATALDGDLYIVRILAPPKPAPSRSLEQSTSGGDVERTLLARSATAAWWGRTLLQPFAEENIQVRIGDFVSEVSAYAHALGAACVILAPTPAGWGVTMTALLRDCRQPVFSTPIAGQPWAALLAAARARR